MTLHAHRYGDGTASYVGLHGWSGDHSTFAPLAPHLPAGRALVALDLPGCGRSPHPSAWSAIVVAAEVARAIEATTESPVTIVGNCSGGLMGLLAASIVPDRIERIVLVDPFAYFPWYFRLFTLGELGRRAYYTTFASSAGRWLTDRSLRARRSETTSLTSSFREVDHEATLRYLGLLQEIESPDRFATLRADIDIVVGERTFGAVHRSVDVWRGVWPHARTHTLRGVGHLPFEEAPEQMGRIVFCNERSL
jgi:pimeloyl-ACP methyl ester carboxylesterase